MPIYCFSCKCGNKFELSLPMSDCSEPQKCECGETAQRDLQTEHGSGNIDGLNKENIRVMRSLGVLDEDLPNARKLHPQVEWKKIGNSWCPVVRNRLERQLLCKQASKCSYYDFD